MNEIQQQMEQQQTLSIRWSDSIDGSTIHGLEKIEARVISSFFNNPSLFESYYLDEDIFLFSEHKVMWKVISEIWEKKRIMDLEYVANELQRYRLVEYFAMQIMGLDGRAIIEKDIEYMNEQYHIRQMKIIASKAYETAEEYETELSGIKSYFNVGTIGELDDEEEIYKLVTQKDTLIQFDIPYMRNFHISANTMNIIATRTGEGKTALALNLAYDLSERYQVLYFNMENPKQMMYQRFVQFDGMLTKSEMWQAEYNEVIKNRVNQSIQNLKRRKLKIFTPKQTPRYESIRRVIKQHAKNELTIVFIDNLNNVKPTKEKATTRETIDYIMKDLINVKGSTNVVIFGLAQIRRNDQKAPTLDALKESGSLEEDSDNVFFIYDMEKKPQLSSYKLYTPKSRNESNYQTYIMFDKTHQYFREPSEAEWKQCELMDK